jgi:predicted metal-dependent HD superfamily phosphohydrolase
MSDERENEFFKLRKQSKTYLSKVFTFNERSTDQLRHVRMVLEGSDTRHTLLREALDMATWFCDA